LLNLALPSLVDGCATNWTKTYQLGISDNHPAGWVIERGGVALLMFVDPVSFGVLQWISCLFVKFASQFHWFYCFSVRWPSNMDISSPEKYSIFGGSFHKVTVGPWFWHMKVVFFSAPRFGHICAKVLPVTNIRNVVGS